MLSFSKYDEIKNVCTNFIQHQYFGAKSLQVPRSSPIILLKKLILLGKRVLPFTPEKRISASVTVEAALVLPLFLFFSAALLAPIRWLDRQRMAQMTTEYFCEKMSQYAYVRECWGDETADDILGIDADEFSGAAAGLWLQGEMNQIAPGVRIKRADVPDEDGNICFETEYQEKIPYFSSVRSDIRIHTAAKRRCWTGLKGKLKAGDEENSTDTEEEFMVYVGAGMGRYHFDKNCHYISNEYEDLSANQAKERKLTPCSICAKDCDAGDTVYITVSGEHYHKTKNCRAMISYVREVPLRDVEHLGACSYCSGKQKVR